MTIPEWQNVPQEKFKNWVASFGDNNEKLFMDAPCSICNKMELHSYYDLHTKSNFISNERSYIGKGGKWEWCSNCRHYAHYSAFVPEYWDTIIDADLSNIKPHPELLESLLPAIISGEIRCSKFSR